MLAKEIMTTNIVTVTPDVSAQDIARMLMEHRISAVPVLNAQGEVVGMVVHEGIGGHRPARSGCPPEGAVRRLVAVPEAAGLEVVVAAMYCGEVGLGSTSAGSVSAR